ncbi:MAG: GGDEF domain-containing protein [Rhodanobacter sp.]
MKPETIDKDTRALADSLVDQADCACLARPMVASVIADDAHGELRLLDSLAAFTHHRDIDALDHSLVLTLAELTSAHSVILAKRGFDEAKLESVVRCAPGGLGVYVVEPLEPERMGSSLQLIHGCLDQLEARTEIVDGLHRQMVPILHDGRAIGALQLDSHIAPSTSRQLIDGFARIYANYTALLYESERDKLTGLYNRRSLERQLQRLLKQRSELVRQVPVAAPVACEQRRAPSGDAPHVWLGILDIDHFKRINDNFGHIYGDEVILLLAQQMRACFRQGDALFRFGGEEFVILFSATDEATVLAVLDRFRQRIADYAFPQIGHITISIGYAKIGEHDYPASAVDRADQALYFVKQHGRNGIRGYEELGASGLLENEKVAGTVDLF